MDVGALDNVSNVSGGRSEGVVVSCSIRGHPAPSSLSAMPGCEEFDDWLATEAACSLDLRSSISNSRCSILLEGG
jgi:hypothetical protein